MRSRLVRIENWEQLAEATNYSLSQLAKKCGTSVRQLERYFLESRGVTPSKWLNELRQRRALQLIGKGETVKEAAAKLGFKQASHFSREFKRFHGSSPTSFYCTTVVAHCAVICVQWVADLFAVVLTC